MNRKCAWRFRFGRWIRQGCIGRANRTSCGSAGWSRSLSFVSVIKVAIGLIVQTAQTFSLSHNGHPHLPSHAVNYYAKDPSQAPHGNLFGG